MAGIILVTKPPFLFPTPTDNPKNATKFESYILKIVSIAVSVVLFEILAESGLSLWHKEGLYTARWSCQKLGSSF